MTEYSNNEIEIVENPYTGLVIEETFTMDSGEIIGYAPSDWLLEMGISQEEIDSAIIRQKWRPIRKERDRLLLESDWIVTKHTENGTEIPNKWILYRQALRDITNQDIDNIVWPTEPT